MWNLVADNKCALILMMTRNKNQKGSQKKHRARREKGEKAAWKRAVSNLMKAGGHALGSYFGGPLGGTLGGIAGSALSKVTGMGDYVIHSNSLMSENVTFGNGSIPVAHREYIGNVYSSIDFATTVYDLNPGLFTTFPWLSVLSKNYERYDIRGLGFEFVSTAGYLTTTQAQGVVVMATQYDPDSDVFVNRREMESYMYTTSGIVTDPQLHMVECDPKDRPLEEMYLRYGAVDEERFTDLGRFTIAVEGCPEDGVILGELWVTYDVHLECPRLEAHGYANASWAMIRNGPFNDVASLGVIQTAPTGPLAVTVSALGSNFDTIVFPPLLDYGIYAVYFGWVGDSTASSITHFLSGCEQLAVWELDTADEICATGTGTVFNCMSVVQVTERGAYIRLTTATLPANGTSIDILIAQVGDPVSSLALDQLSYLEALEQRGLTVTHPIVERERHAVSFVRRQNQLVRANCISEDDFKEDEEEVFEAEVREFLRRKHLREPSFGQR